MRRNFKYIFSSQLIFLQLYKLGFLIKQILKKVAYVDVKICCNFIAVTFSQISFQSQINSTIAHLFSTCVISRLTLLKHMKKSERKFFFRSRCCLFSQKACLVSRSVQAKFEFSQNSRFFAKVAFNLKH